MAVWSVTVAGADRTAYVQACQWSGGINEIGSLSVTFLDRSGTWVPDEQTEIVVFEDGLPRFRGIILEVEVSFLVRWRGVRCVCKASDVAFLATLDLLNRPEASGQTLKAVLQSLIVNPLSAKSITLDAGQANGPTLGELTFAWLTAFDVLVYLSKITGWVFRFDAARVLSMWALGSRSAPVSLLQTDRSILAISWSKSVEAYRNAQWLIYGPDKELEVSDSWTGNGSSTSFALSYALGGVAGVGGAAPGVVTEGGVWYPVGGARWTYNAGGHAVVAATAPANGVAISVNYRARFPQAHYSEDAAEVARCGRWVRKDAATEIESATEAATLAAALRRVNMPRPRRLKARTLEAGFDPGESVVVNVPKLGAVGTFYVEKVTADLLMLAGAKRFVYTLELFDGGERPESWVEMWKRIAGGASASSGSASGSGSSSGSSGPGAFAASLGGSRSRAVRGSTGSPTTVKPRIVCVESGATVGEGAATSSATWETQSFAIMPEAGAKTYKLALVTSAGDACDAEEWIRVPIDASVFSGVTITAKVDVRVDTALDGVLGIGGLYA